LNAWFGRRLLDPRTEWQPPSAIDHFRIGVVPPLQLSDGHRATGAERI